MLIESGTKMSTGLSPRCLDATAETSEVADNAVFNVLNGPLLICLGGFLQMALFVLYAIPSLHFFEELRDEAGLCSATCELDPFSHFFVHWVLFLVWFTVMMMSGEHCVFAIYN